MFRNFWLSLAAIALSLVPVRAAYREVSSFEIETNGWVAKVLITGFGTNGVFNSGFNPNPSGQGQSNWLSGAEKLVLHVNSPGYDSTGSTTTVRRLVYGTKLLRRPFPDQAFNDSIASGTDAFFRIALSERIYHGDGIAATHLADGFISVTNGSGTNCIGVTNPAVVFNTTARYPMVVGNWTWPGWNHESNATMRVRAVAFHQSAEGGRPVACMKFIVRDQHSNARTNVETDMRIDYSLPDVLLTGEYISDFTLNVFTNLDELRVDFIGYPRVGLPYAVLDTTLDLFKKPLPSSITNLYGLPGTYTDLIAVVSLGGNDTTGRPTNCAPELVTSSHHFATIDAAAHRLAGTNFTLFGHGDTGGTFIFGRNGVTNWTDGSLSASNVPKAWCTILPYPGDTLTLTNRSNDQDIQDRVRFFRVNLEFNNPTTLVPFSGIEALWLDQCKLDSAGSGPLQNCTNVFVTHCRVTNWVQGLRPNGTQLTPHNLVRGNDLRGFNNSILFSTAIGNWHTDTNGSGISLINGVTGSSVPTDFQILYNNFLGGKRGSGTFLSFGDTGSITNGIALVQNGIESCTTNSGPLGGFSASGNHHSTNVIIWHNTLVGERIADWGQGAAGASSDGEEMWSILNNIVDLSGYKDDVDMANGARLGTWPLIYQVGASGNFYGEVLVNGAAATFHPDFPGLHTYTRWPTTNSFPNSTNNTAFYIFRDRRSWGGVGYSVANGPPGNGDYRLLNGSPVINWSKPRWVLPFDLDGRPRGAVSPAGAFGAGDARKKGMF